MKWSHRALVVISPNIGPRATKEGVTAGMAFIKEPSARKPTALREFISEKEKYAMRIATGVPIRDISRYLIGEQGIIKLEADF